MAESILEKNKKEGNSKFGALSLFCGIWGIVLGGLGYIGIGFYFDDGGQLLSIMSKMQHYIFSVGSGLFIIGIMMAFLLFITGAVFLFVNKSKKRISLIGCYMTFSDCLLFLTLNLYLMSFKEHYQGLMWVILLCMGSLLPVYFLNRLLTKENEIK